MKVVDTKKFHVIMITDNESLLVPKKNLDIDKYISEHKTQISVLNKMIKEHNIDIIAFNTLRAYLNSTQKNRKVSK